MIVTIERYDGTLVRLDLDEVVTIAPENGGPSDPAKLILTTGECMIARKTVAALKDDLQEQLGGDENLPATH